MKINDEYLRHLKSFLKTYVTVFLGIYLFGIEQQGKDLLDWLFIIETAKFSLVSVLRTIYKLLTEQ